MQTIPSTRASTTPRAMVINKLPKVTPDGVENILQSLLRMAQRMGGQQKGNAVVLMTLTNNICIDDVYAMFCGDQQDRISAHGIEVLIHLYEWGFFTGYAMGEPKMVQRIAQHMTKQALAA